MYFSQLQLSIGDGTILSANVVVIPGYLISVNGWLTNNAGMISIEASMTQISSGYRIIGTIVDEEGMIIQFSLSIEESFLETAISGEAHIRVESLGEAQVSFQVSNTLFGTTHISLRVDANFEPEDLIEWLCLDPADADIRDQLLQYLPTMQIIWMFGLNTSFFNEDFDGDLEDDGLDNDGDGMTWMDDSGIFGAFDPTDPDYLRFVRDLDGWDDPPVHPDLSLFGGDIFVDGDYPPVFFEDSDGNVYILEGMGWVSVDDLVVTSGLGPTALVHVPGLGRSGWIEVIAPRGYVHVDQIVAEALQL